MMEKRAILAAVLMAGLLMAYQFLFFKPTEQKPAPPDKQPAPQTQNQAPPGRAAEAPQRL